MSNQTEVPGLPKEKYRIARSGSAVMRPRARIISLIGEELISDEPVALVELVKNAYDADASYVSVRFEGEDPARPNRIIVEDDGEGMNLNTVLHAWFEPGTNAKRQRKTSPAGRVYQGAKGIGRFASARLAEYLFLETIPNTDDGAVSALVEWGAFNEESFLDEISVDYEIRDKGGHSHGTRLTLEVLRKHWSHEDYENLHSRLSRLISPFADVHDFQINLEIPAYPEFSGPVEPPAIVLKPVYSLVGDLDNEGRFSGRFAHMGNICKFFENVKLGGEGQRPACGPLSVEVRVWDRDRESLAPIAESFNHSITEVRRILNNYSGVSIYRDGFRVYPYGQKGNDWLNLDHRSRQNPSMHLANNQVVAAIQVSRKANPDLQDRSNREGMILNAAHAALENWFVEILQLLENERYKLRPRQRAETLVDPLFEVFDLGSTFELARSELGTQHPVTQQISETQRKLKEGVERVQDVYSRLLLSAGLGHMVDIVIHEIGAPLGKINRKLELLEKRLRDRLTAEEHKMFSPVIADIKTWLVQIHSLRQRLDPQTPDKRGKATAFNVEDEVRDTFELYRALISKQRIMCTIDAPDEPVKVMMSRAALGQILANLTDNSIFWLVRSKGVGNGGRIDVKLAPTEHGFRLIFSDDGPGVPEEDVPNIFEPYFSRKPSGIGLGLHIARLVIEPYGKIFYREDCALAGACFEVEFERSVGR